MAKSKLQLIVERNANNKVKGVKKFAGEIGMDITPWEDGDKITFDADIHKYAYERVINGNKVQYVLVTVNGDENDVREWYPSTLRRMRRTATALEDDPTRAEYLPDAEMVRAGGNIINRDSNTPEDFETYKESVSIDSFMQQLAGKTIAVSVQEVPTIKYGTENTLAMDKVYSYDLVG